MVNPNDKMSIAIAIQEHDKIKANYHFSNEEYYELLRCETTIKSFVETYADRLDDLYQLCKELPRFFEFLTPELQQQVKNHGVSNNNQQVFYSFNGQKFATLEEATLRNEELQNNLTAGPKL